MHVRNSPGSHGSSDSVSARRAAGSRGRSGRSQAGFSLLELLIVVIIIGIMLAVSIIAFNPARRASLVDDSANQLLSFFREGNNRAITQRQTMRMVIDKSADPPRIELWDNGTTAVGDETRIRQEILARANQIQIATAAPTNATTAIPAPFDFGVPTFASNQWEVFFRSDGAMTATAAPQAPQSVKIYIYPPGTSSTAASSPTLVRAITVFGPTTMIRFWRWDGTNWQSR